ncbi:hypothetical protein HanRHA438_Chr10g0448591 [Helianthus annuus]|nr:hypothetical protein HanRHA438_Chr10g0448591 [Helianthus annuus]
MTSNNITIKLNQHKTAKSFINRKKMIMKEYLGFSSISLSSSALNSHLRLLLEINLEINDNGLALQIPDLDAGLSGRTEPVPVRAEAKSVNDAPSFERVESLTLREIPEQNHAVFATTGTQGTIRGDRNSVDVSGVAGQGGPELAVGEVPDLDGLIPGGRNNGGLESVGAETNAAHPVSVRISVLNGVLALAQSVPELDGLVPRGGYDLPVVDGESHGEDVFGVPHKAPGGGSSVQIPQPELSVPRAREGELAVGGKDHVLDKVRVPGQTPLCHTVSLVFLGQTPHDD